MKLKELFLLLVSRNQKVEIYYSQENRDDEFGFKINNLDSRILWKKGGEMFDAILEKIENEICNAFLSSELIEKGEGATSYFLKSDGSCIKQAKYFDWVSETDQIWIKENETEFVFGNVDLPIHQIIIRKDSNSFIVYEEKELQKFLPEDLYNRFIKFYQELLNPFQEVEVILQIDYNEKNNQIIRILNIQGSYREIMMFNLLDKSDFDFEKIELKKFLELGFSIEGSIIDKVFNK